MKKDRKPIEQHPAMVRFRSALASLIKPSLEPLAEIVTDMIRSIGDDRRDVETELERVRSDGHEAASRLVTSDKVQAADMANGRHSMRYLQRMQQPRG